MCVGLVSKMQYAFAITDEGVDECQASGSAFSDGIATSTEIEPAQFAQIERAAYRAGQIERCGLAQCCFVLEFASSGVAAKAK